MKKICSGCKEEKNLEKDFYKDKSSPTGYQYHCKKCAKITSQQSHKKNYSRMKEKHDEWIENHKEQWQNYYKSYIKSEQEKAIERRKKRIKAEREKNMQ
jgi:hypothetical protein